MTLKMDLKEATANRLPKFVDDDLCADFGGDLLFITGVFNNGFVIGFWSHSPWGNTRNQDRGWAVLDADGAFVSSCATFYHGHTHDNFREWRESVSRRFGKATKLCDEFSGETLWKMSEA